MVEEKSRSFWRGLDYTLGKRRGNSVTLVKVPNGHGGVRELTTQREVQTAIWQEVHQSRYHLAEEAPLCLGNLCGMFGYNADTWAARQVLENKFRFPDDFHEATK